jgi:hypothetical protein
VINSRKNNPENQRNRIVSAPGLIQTHGLTALKRAGKTETEKVFEKPQRKSGKNRGTAADVDESETLKEKAIIKILGTL